MAYHAKESMLKVATFGNASFTPEEQDRVEMLLAQKMQKVYFNFSEIIMSLFGWFHFTICFFEFFILIYLFFFNFF